MRLSKLMGDYIRWFAAHGASTRSVDTYDTIFSRFTGFIVEQGLLDDVASFNPDTVSAYASRELSRGLKASTVNLALAALGSLGKYGMKTRDPRGRWILAENPLDRIHRPKKVKPAPKYLSVAEVKALLAVPAVAPERLAVDMLVDTALRASELVHADVGDVRLDGEDTILSVKVKGGAHREVVLGPVVAARLFESLAFREAKPADPLLVSALGNRYTRTTLSEAVLRLARRAGITRIPVRAHVLRHSVATLASASGAEIPVIAALLNHADINTVSKYVHRSGGVDAARAAVRRMLGIGSTEPNEQPSA